MPCAAFSAPLSNHTEKLTATARDISVDLVTLTLSARDMQISEHVPIERDVLRVGSVKVSLEFMRSLLFWRFQIDCFQMRDVYVSILRDSDGKTRLFNKEISAKEISKLFAGEKEQFDEKRSEVKRDNAPDVSIPYLSISNLNIACLEHDTREKLWSIDNIRVEIQDFFYPPEENPDVWRADFSAGFNDNPASSLEIAVACRTLPTDPFLCLKIDARRIDGAMMDMIVNTGKLAEDTSSTNTANAKDEKAEREDDTPFGAVFHYFSNDIARLETAFKNECSAAATNANVTNFLATVPVTNMTFDFFWDMTISNRVFAPGKIRLKMYPTRGRMAPLTFGYRITNSPALLVPWKEEEKQQCR